jgi:hypothetical protein
LSETHTFIPLPRNHHCYHSSLLVCLRTFPEGFVDKLIIRTYCMFGVAPQGDGTLRYATGLGSNSSNERQLRANLTGDDDENNGKEKTNGKPDAVVTEPT